MIASALQAPPPLTIQRRFKRQAEQEQARWARVDPVVFNEYVMRDERTLKPLKLAPMHVEWHDLMNKHDRLVMWAHIEAGKTTQIAGRILYELGRNPNLRIAIVSNTVSQAEKILKAVKQYIEESDALREVFPGLRRGRGSWSGASITVARPTVAKDPSVQAVGVHGNVLGARFDLIILDDILDYENTNTVHNRDALMGWLSATIFGRLTHDARLWCIGTPWHPDDVYHVLAKRPTYVSRRYPAINADGDIAWPRPHVLEWLRVKKADLTPLEYARQILCMPRSDDEARFKRAYIEKCAALGLGKFLIWALKSLPAGYKTFTGVDLAVQQHASADLTSLFTILVHPDETRQVLCIESGRWTGPEIVERIIDTHRRFHSMFVVENVAAQDYILQFTRKRAAIPMTPFTTGRNKAHPEFGVESLAAEMANEKWIIPSGDSGSDLLGCETEVLDWIQEMLFYDPRKHTGDRLMASWFAREGARKSAGSKVQKLKGSALQR